MGGKYTEAQKKASIKYLNDKTDSIQIRVQKGKKDVWRKAAETSGKSLQQFIIDAVEDAIVSATKKEGV